MAETNESLKAQAETPADAEQLRKALADVRRRLENALRQPSK